MKMTQPTPGTRTLTTRGRGSDNTVSMNFPKPSSNTVPHKAKTASPGAGVATVTGRTPSHSP